MLSASVSTEKLSDDAWIRLADMDKPLALIGCDELLAHFTSILCAWPHETGPGLPQGESPFLFVERRGCNYSMHLELTNQSKIFSDPVDLVCAAIVEIAWETLRCNPDWLCLHCAAVEKNGRLIIFPNMRRAGKTTLTTALGLRGLNVYTDDFMALTVQNDGQVLGMASGIATRMRLPWPRNISGAFKIGLSSSELVRGARYSYHAVSRNMPVRRGHRSPVGAVVILDFENDRKAELLPINRAEALRATITQNFSRAGNSGRILQILYFLICNLKTFRLRYSDTEEAADLIENHFGSWETPLPKEPALKPGLASHIAPDFTMNQNRLRLPTGKQFVRSPDVVEYELDDTRFLADGKGYGIYKLDQLSGAAWNVLETPATADEIIELFQQAFPDQPVDRIACDVQKLLRGLLRNRLITDI
ncbi:MAG: PqqD family protein [Pseudomonadota bacterium]